jgi:ferrochelatase
LILHGIVLRVRPAKSARKYKSIWTPQGSPLAVHTQKQAQDLQQLLARQGCFVQVRCAMRYGQAAVAEQLEALKAQGVDRVLILPAYPQYCAATTASLFDVVYAWASRVRALPELRFVNHYHDHPGYIAALADRVRRHWQAHGQAQVLVMSFHGVPARSLHLGDPYHCECRKTARLLAEQLKLSPAQFRVTFQSRFGRAKWLEPYTEATLVALAQSGVQRVDVICPGFTSDCLETLEEINIEARQAFLAAGGQRFEYIPCLNDDALFVQALAALVQQHMSGWPHAAQSDSPALAAAREAALALGALQ